MSLPRIIAYITGHGYGHFVRSSAVLERVAAHAEVHLRTNARALAIAHRARWAASVSEVDVGPGVVQRGPLHVDLPATREVLAAHLDVFPALVEREAEVLRAQHAQLVFADLPPLGLAAAARAGLPAYAFGNFSWSWIYRAYARSDPWFGQAADQLAASEAQATMCLALGMGGGLEVFARRIAIAPVGRPPTADRGVLRARLGVDPADPRPLVLLSFGGFGGELDLEEAAAHAPDLRLLVVSAPIATPRPDLQPIEPDPERPHHDLVYAADCVLGKLGYGTVVECFERPTPLVYVPRGDFCEEPALAAAVERSLPHARLSFDDFRRGRWSQAVHQALASKPPAPAPRTDGAATAAAAILTGLARTASTRP